MLQYPTSIRRRLLLFMLGILLVVVVATAAITYRVALDVATHAYDRSLFDPALVLVESVHVGEDGPRLELSGDAQRALLFDESDTLVFQILDNTGRLIAGEPDLPVPGSEIIDAHGFFYDGTWRGTELRIAALRTGTGLLVQVGETLNKRTRLIWQVLITALVPTLLVAAAALTLVLTSIVHALIPLERVRMELIRRSATDLGPLDTGSAPVEVRPAVLALNHLFERLREANALQDRFLANAAHQLRTPLAGLQMQLELLMRLPHTREVREQLEKIHVATRRTSRLANQLLALARADRTAEAGRRQVVDLYRVGDLAARDWTARAIEKDIDLGFDLQHAAVSGDDLLLRELLANLIDNALLYTPANGVVTVRCGTDANGAFLSVEDNGPGIPDGARAYVFDRFYRVEGTPGEGSGLGLAIVKEIAERHEATVQVESPEAGSGLVITVRFPRPDIERQSTDSLLVPAVPGTPSAGLTGEGST